MCNGIFPGISWLTYLHWHTHCKGLQSWLHSRHFPHDVVSAHISMLVHHTPTLTCSDVECIVRNVQKVAWAIAHVICQTFSSSIKTHVIRIPVPFSEARQLCTKGPSERLISGIFWAPCLSTSINVFELFFHLAAAYWYINR